MTTQGRAHGIEIELAQRMTVFDLSKYKSAARSSHDVFQKSLIKPLNT